MREPPAGFLITFHTYGTWLRGRAEGSVDRDHNQFGAPVMDASPAMESGNRAGMTDEPLILDDTMRATADSAMRAICERRIWSLGGLNVRTTHVHAVVAATNVPSPERVMNDLKAFATKALRDADLLPADRRVWSRHGSTRWIWNADELAQAIDYVLNHQ